MKLMQGLVSVGLLIIVCAMHGGRQFLPERVTRPGERYQDVLRESDPMQVEPPHGLKRRWAFNGQAGQRVTIAAESYEFNIYLLLLDPWGQQIAWSDDNGWFFNARIRTTLPAAGHYTVIVCGANADQYGTYWLSLEAGDHEVDWNESAIAAYYRRGIEWAQREENRRAVSWLNLTMGQYFRQRRQWLRAEGYYTKSLAAAEQIGFVYGQWAVSLERGTLLTQRMRYDQAVGELQRALELSKKLRAADQAEAAVSTQLGDLYCYIQRRDLADVHYRNAAKLAEHAGLPSVLVRLYCSLFDFVRLQDKDKAFEYAQKADALREGVDPVAQLTAFHTLADAYLMSGRSKEGLTLATEARDMAHRLGCLDKEISILTRMSMEYGSLHRVDEMIRSAREAAELTNPDDEDPDPRRIALQMQADGEMLRGNGETALQLCLNALQTTEDAWTRASTEELRQRFLSQSKAICTQIIKNLMTLNARQRSGQYACQAFDFAERSRSRTLLDQLAAPNTGAPSAVDAQLLEQERGLLEQISAGGRQIVLVHAQANVDPRTLDQLERERARLVCQRMQLEAKTRCWAGNRHDAAGLSPLTAEQVQRGFLAAHPKAAILFYQFGTQESFLIVLTREQAHLFKLPDWRIISGAVAEWRAQIRGQLNLRQDPAPAVQAYGHIAHQLYQMLIQPAARLIQGRDLIIVPDGALHSLAFEGLVTSPPSPAKDFGQLHYLVEDHGVTYTPSISVLVEIERRQAHTGSETEKKLLLLGDAVFNERDPRIAQNKLSQPEPADELAMASSARLRAGLHRLPATREEVLSIARLAQSCQWSQKVWLDFEASEHNLKTDDLTVYRLVHLATHAAADPDEGDFSGIILSAIDNQSDDDGLLTAAEVARLQLKADLIVLSGCSTGGGQLTKAEGIIGLSRAFLVAGAQRVCASLWNVEDNSTRQLMTILYDHLLAKGEPTSQALQQAKVKLLRRRAAPFFWAPFVLVGSPGEAANRQ